MIVFAYLDAMQTTKVGNAMRFVYRCHSDDGTYAEDVPVNATKDILGVINFETKLDADVRLAIANAFSSRLGLSILATDVRIR